MSPRCEIFAELLVDERAPERSGQRLVEWAATCRTSGVVIPHREWVTPALLHKLCGEATRHQLTCYVELGPSTGARLAESVETDGYLLRRFGVDEELLMRLLRLRDRKLLLAVGAKEGFPRDGLRAFLDPERVTLLYIERNEHPCLPLMKQFERWGCPLGYADTTSDLWHATLSVLAGARVVLKGLTLNRSLAGAALSGGLYPHELHRLVERIRQQESLQAELRGEAVAVTPAQMLQRVVELERTQGLVAGRPLQAGDVLQPQDLKQIQELQGLSAVMASRLMGTRLLYDRQPDEPITFGMIEPLTGRTVSEPIDISVVIRSKNEARWLRRCLAALVNQHRPPKEIIVVDNNSSDGTVAIASSFGCQILTMHDDEFTFGRALNAGMAAARSPWVVSLSAHCIPLHDQWLSAFARECPSAFVAAVYGRQEPLPDTSDFDKRDLWTTFGAERRVQFGQDYFFHNANSMISKAAWERIRFDEGLSGLEDRDWAKKVLADGYQIIYAPLASVHHYHGIHHGRNEDRVKRVVRVIELIQQREPAGLPTR